MRRLLVSLLPLWLATPALAQLSIQVGPGGLMVQSAPISNGYSVSYRPSSTGASALRIFGLGGVQVRVMDGMQLVAAGGCPLWAPALPGHVYRIAVSNPDGSAWEQPVAAQAGMTAMVSIGGAPVMDMGPGGPPPPAYGGPPPGYAAPPPVYVNPGPLVMAEPDFERLLGAINAEAFPQNKIGVLRSAAQGTGFTCDQVGRLVDLFAFPNDKVKAVEITRPGLVDPQNGFTLFGHFAFPDDKEKVRRILGR